MYTKLAVVKREDGGEANGMLSVREGLTALVVLIVPSGAAQCTFALVAVSRKIAHLPRGHEKRPFTFVYNVDDTLVCWPGAD